MPVLWEIYAHLKREVFPLNDLPDNCIFTQSYVKNSKMYC